MAQRCGLFGVVLVALAADLAQSETRTQRLRQPVPAHVRDAQVDVVGQSMGKQLEGLRELKGEVETVEVTLRRTDAVAENRTYLLGKVVKLSEDLPAVMAPVPVKLAEAFKLVPNASAPAGMNESLKPAFEAAVAQMRGQLISAAEGLVTNLATRVSNVTQLLRANVDALHEVKSADAMVTTDLGDEIRVLGGHVDDQISAMAQTRDLFASSEVKNAGFELHDDLNDLKTDLAGIRESLSPGKIDQMAGAGFDNARKTMQRWRSKRDKLRRAVQDYARIKGKANDLVAR